MAGRPAGSKIIACPTCGATIAVIVGTKKECRHCGKEFRVTKKYLKEIGKL